MAGLRPSSPTVATSPARLHFSLLRDLQRVVDLDPEVSDFAFQLAMRQRFACPECVGVNDVAHSCQDKFAQSGPAHFVIQQGPHGIGTLHSQSAIKDFFRTLA